MLCKRGLSRHAMSVRVCVCPSVTFVHFVKTNKHIFNCFSLSSSHSSFPHQTVWQYSDANPLTGASSAGVVGRNRDSKPISGFIACCEPFQQHCKRSTLSCDEPWRVYNTSLCKWRSLLMAGNNDEVNVKKPQRYAEYNVTQW